MSEEPHTAFHEELVTVVARLEIDVEVVLPHDHEQLAECQSRDRLVLREDQQHELPDDDEEEHVVLRDRVIQLVDLLHFEGLWAVRLEEQVALRKDGDELKAEHARDAGVVVRLDL